MHPIRVLLASLTVALCVTAATPAPAATPYNESFVERLFSDFHLRGADEDEVTHWADLLDAGEYTYAQLVDVFAHSDESRDLWTSALYEGYLGRDPSVGELSLWRTYLGSGSYLQVEKTLLTSNEYRATNGSSHSGVIAAWYRDVAFRAADASGLAYWATRLAGDDDEFVAEQFVRTTEVATKRVAGIGGGASPCSATALIVDDPSTVTAGSYCVILKRPADANGRSHWVDRLQNQGGELPELWTALAKTAEYRALANL